MPDTAASADEDKAAPAAVVSLLLLLFFFDANNDEGMAIGGVNDLMVESIKLTGLICLRDSSRHLLYSFVIDSRRAFQNLLSRYVNLAPDVAACVITVDVVVDVVVTASSKPVVENWHTRRRLCFDASFMPTLI